MRNILAKFGSLLLELLNSKKVIETWYLWFPWTNILFIIIATYLIGQVSFRILLDFSSQKQIIVLILLILFSIIKSYLIGKYTATINNKRFSILSFIYHFPPSFFLIWTFYVNWNTWSVILLLLFDLSVSFLSNWLIERKVYAHILADIASLFFFGGLIFFKINTENTVIDFIFVILFVTLRYLLVTSFYDRINLKNIFSWKQKSGKFYWFSELLSTGLFLIVLSAVFEELSKEISPVVILPGILVYYIFLYLRLFLYKQFVIYYKELYYFVTTGGGVLVYIWLINWVDIDIVVWFFPAVIILILDDFIYLGYQRYTNQVVELSLQGKQLFSKLKLFSLISLFIYNIISENEQRFLCYKIFGFTLNQIDNSIFRDYFLFPFLAILIAIIISIFIFKIINSLLQSHSYLTDRKNNKVIKSMKYKFSRRLHKRK